MFVLTTCNPRTLNVYAPANSPKLSLLTSLPTLLVLESSLQSENVTYCPQAVCSCVKLQSQQNIYEKFAIQLTKVGLTQARPNEEAAK